MSDKSSYVVVTGSTSGIGQAIAWRIAQAGSNVVVHGSRNRQGAEETAVRIDSLGQKAQIVMADISNEAERLRLVETAFSFGNIQAWVHNAGADVLTGPAAALSFEDKLDRLWAVDVRGTILLARLVGHRMLAAVQSPDPESSQLPSQRQNSKRSMVFIGWDQAAEGMEGDAGQMFGPTKSAITSFSKSLAQHLAPHIRVNCVAPGWVQTAWGESTDDYWDRRARESSLMNRWGSPEDIAAAVHYLISAEADFISGQVLEVNGGWNRRYNRS